MSQNPVIHVLYRLYPLYQKSIPWHLAIWNNSQQMDHSALPRLGNVHLMHELCHDVSWCVILSLLFLTKKDRYVANVETCWDMLRHVETKLPWAHGPRCPGSGSADVPWPPAPRPAPGAPAAGTAPRCRTANGGRPRPTGRAPAARSRTRLGRWRPSPWCLWWAGDADDAIDGDNDMIGLEMGTVLAADLLRVFGVADLKSYTIVGQLDMGSSNQPRSWCWTQGIQVSKELLNGGIYMMTWKGCSLAELLQLNMHPYTTGIHRPHDKVLSLHQPQPVHQKSK